MDKITASARTLMDQASDTAHGYLLRALSDIDEVMGEGYAKAHPDLIAAFMKTAALDYAAASITSGLQDISEAIETYQSPES